MQIESTPWHETRSLISPQIEMLRGDGMIQYRDSFLKKESPKNAVVQKRFIAYDVSYVKYCLLKEFYQLLFDSARQETSNSGDDESKLIALFAGIVIDFGDHCREHPFEENARELFRAYCKVRLFKS